MTIAETATRAAADLRSKAPRARSRTLDASEIERAIRKHLKIARRIAKLDPTRKVTTTLVGGHVVNSYKYRADTDLVCIEGVRAAGLTIHTSRCHAQRRPGGQGATLIVRSRLPEQSQGRIEHSE
jgi:hypothetical protein